MSLVQTPEEKLEVAEAELSTARAIFKARNHALKEFDRAHAGILVLSAEEAEEREGLGREQGEALAALREAEENHRFCRREIYAERQRWGRPTQEPWRE
jgi:hypothetical protein